MSVEELSASVAILRGARDVVELPESVAAPFLVRSRELLLRSPGDESLVALAVSALQCWARARLLPARAGAAAPPRAPGAWPPGPSPPGGADRAPDDVLGSVAVPLLRCVAGWRAPAPGSGAESQPGGEGEQGVAWGRAVERQRLFAAALELPQLRACDPTLPGAVASALVRDWAVSLERLRGPGRASGSELWGTPAGDWVLGLGARGCRGGVGLRGLARAVDLGAAGPGALGDCPEWEEASTGGRGGIRDAAVFLSEVMARGRGAGVAAEAAVGDHRAVLHIARLAEAVGVADDPGVHSALRSMLASLGAAPTARAAARMPAGDLAWLGAYPQRAAESVNPRGYVSREWLSAGVLEPAWKLLASVPSTDAQLTDLVRRAAARAAGEGVPATPERRVMDARALSSWLDAAHDPATAESIRRDVAGQLAASRAVLVRGLRGVHAASRAGVRLTPDVGKYEGRGVGRSGLGMAALAVHASGLHELAPRGRAAPDALRPSEGWKLALEVAAGNADSLSPADFASSLSRRARQLGVVHTLALEASSKLDLAIEAAGGRARRGDEAPGEGSVGIRCQRPPLSGDPAPSPGESPGRGTDPGLSVRGMAEALHAVLSYGLPILATSTDLPSDAPIVLRNMSTLARVPERVAALLAASRAGAPAAGIGARETPDALSAGVLLGALRDANELAPWPAKKLASKRSVDSRIGSVVDHVGQVLAGVAGGDAGEGASLLRRVMSRGRVFAPAGVSPVCGELAGAAAESWAAVAESSTSTVFEMASLELRTIGSTHAMTLDQVRSLLSSWASLSREGSFVPSALALQEAVLRLCVLLPGPGDPERAVALSGGLACVGHVLSGAGRRNLCGVDRAADLLGGDLPFSAVPPEALERHPGLRTPGQYATGGTPTAIPVWEAVRELCRGGLSQVAGVAPGMSPPDAAAALSAARALGLCLDPEAEDALWRAATAVGGGEAHGGRGGRQQSVLLTDLLGLVRVLTASPSQARAESWERAGAMLSEVDGHLPPSVVDAIFR